MSKILISITSLDRGGAEKQCLYLASCLQKNHQVLVVSMKSSPKYQRHLDFIQKNGIQVLFLEGGILNKIKMLVTILKEQKIDTVFSYLPYDIILSTIAAKLAGVKHVFGGIRNSRLPFLKNQVLKLLHNFFLHKSISNSYVSKKLFSKRGFNLDKMIVIPNALDKIPAQIIRKPKKRIEILSVSRFVKEKDYLTAIKALAVLKKASPESANFVYKMVGFGELEEQIRSWITSYDLEDHVELIIDPPQVMPHFEQADIYLCSSIEEGLSNSVMEAMSYSLPIVATNVGDNSYLVSNNFNGYIAEQKDYNKLKEGLQNLMEPYDLRIQYGKNSYKRISEKYSIGTFEKNYHKELKELNYHQEPYRFKLA